MNKIIIYIVIVLIGLMLYGVHCTQTEKQQGSTKNVDSLFPIQIFDTSLVLGWDAPVEVPDFIDHYELLYQSIKKQKWTVLRENIPTSDSPRITISRNEVAADDTGFIFAVRSVAANGLKSELLVSSDTNAFPPKWFVLWPPR